MDGESLAFNPFHVSDAGLLPLGRLNRARLSAYANSQRVRHERNQVNHRIHMNALPRRKGSCGRRRLGIGIGSRPGKFRVSREVFERRHARRTCVR